MPSTFVSEGIKPPIHDQVSELQRKIQLLEGDRNAYFESSQSAIKKNRETILHLRKENKNLHNKLAEALSGDEHVIREAFQRRGVERAAFRNMSGKEAWTVVDQKVCDKMKKLNALKHITQTHRRKLDDLNQYQNMKPENGSPLSDAQKQEDREKKEGDFVDVLPQKNLRFLENRLEKVQLKSQEAEHIMHGYLKLKEHLQEESLTFQPQLDRLEAEIYRQTQELKDLQVINSDAHLSRDAAQAELQLQGEQVYRERRERERILYRYKKQAEEKKAQAERVERRAQRVPMHPDEMSSEAQRSATGIGDEEEAISAFEDAFQRIKEATGVTDTWEIVDRFISQGKTQKHLEKMKAENEKTLLQLKKERSELQAQFQDMKYSGEAKLSQGQQVLQECERHLQQKQQSLDAAKDHLDWLTRPLNSAKEGVQHLSDKLQHISLQEKGSVPQLTPDVEEYVLQLLSDAEEKLKLLKEELQGKDQATIMKEMEEEEFHASIEGKLPQYNIRVQLPEAQKLDPYGDEEKRDDDEGDIVTRTTLKRQSQLIIDAKTKRKTRIKKRKGKL